MRHLDRQHNQQRGNRLPMPTIAENANYEVATVQRCITTQQLHGRPTLYSVYLRHAVSLPASSRCSNRNSNPNPNFPKFNQLFSGPNFMKMSSQLLSYPVHNRQRQTDKERSK